MELKVLSKNEIAQAIGEEIIALVNNNPKCILGLATGSSPLTMYAYLVEAYKKGRVSFKEVTSYNLDEYIGLDVTNDQSYRYFMNHNLFLHIDIDLNNTHVPNGLNVEESIKNYDNEIKNSGGVDLQVLGIGSNGHIAFNEPGTSFDSLTHTVDLKESTIKDNSRFFASLEETPTKAITMGLRSIMNAKRIVLIATGKNKALAIKRLFEEEKTIDLPASILQDHPNVTIFCDEDAASMLTR